MMMRPHLLIPLAALALTGCPTSNLGSCRSDGDCPSGARCDLSQATPVCAPPLNACFPACTSAQVCNTATQACDPATGPSVALTTPQAATAADTTLDVAATASAPGGVSAVQFQLVQGGTVKASVAGTPSASGPARFTATLSLAAAAEGPSEVRAVATYAGGTATSTPVPVLVDRSPPVIDQINVAAGPTDVPPFYDNGPTPLLVTARIVDAGGLSAGSICLVVAGESGCAHPGTSGGGNLYQFSLPRRPGDGTVATTYTITAADMVGASHVATSPTRSVTFDDQPPAIAIAAEPKFFARTADVIMVTATITDPAGVVVGSPKLVSNGVQIAASSSTPPAFTFALPATDAPPGVEGAYGFQVTATDKLGHVAQVAGTRNIDDAAPSITVQIYKDVPDAGVGVTYPAAVAGTGWDGTQFVYSDTVHVKVHVADQGSIGSVSLRVDGVGFGGGVFTGTSTPIVSCTAAPTCDADVQVTLSNAGTQFHTGMSPSPAAGETLSAPRGTMQFVIDATDRAQLFDGGTAGNPRSTTTPAAVTRLLWQMTLPNSVSGLAVHPNGDLIVTQDGGTSTVAALNTDIPQIRWSQDLGAIDAEPAVGQGDGGTAPIYVATRAGLIRALAPDGGSLWTQDAGPALAVGPAVFNATPNGGTPFEQVIVPGNTSTAPKVFGAASGGIVSAVSSGQDAFSDPVIVGTAVYFGTGSDFERHPLSNGGIGARTTYGVPTIYRQFSTDATDLFVTRDDPNNQSNAGLLSVKTNQALDFNWAATLFPSALPVLNGGELVTPVDANVLTLDPATGLPNSNPFAALGGISHAALVGSGGHVYFLRDSAVTYAYTSAGQLSWGADPNGATFRAATMDCKGRLFAASNNLTGTQSLVYAIQTDDQGLANTPWPSYRRDTRNTGNTGMPKYGIRLSTGCTQ